ncbi:ABC transporter substrate-binding protein [Thermocoleostomius sinensis]|uniref:Spermidine/putrescine ABC transporter substrate-binding protein n=1 Tax=Thermocoleostomius sinensis A174 TaxID=2016057 RepID=A0A9E8ZP21_9CYAN|nr:spermidine/putrescine ABC transporter substrate-binding protein [Thermocoleostomius sinensis]WAL62141.1 spermidine/putrescine ABC transporter substrate-binding protein [Thermocoleostomius sinensis A174]
MPPQNPRISRWRQGRASTGAVFTRRRFIQASAAAASGVALSNCARNLSNNQTQAPPTSSPTAADPNTLYVYTWANYTDDELIQTFQDQTGVRVVVDLYDSNETMLAKLEAGGGSQYSVVYPSDYAVTQMLESNLLAELDQSQLQGLNNLREPWQNPSYDPGNAHSIPTTWGTTGLAYNPETLGTDIQGWDYLFDNVDSLSRQVTLLNDVREVFGAILMHLGYSLNSTNPAEIEEAYQALVQLRPTIASFLTNGWEDQLASGDFSISMAYSTDAIALIDDAPELTYIVPESGSSIWTDTMAILKTAPNPDAAYAWINYILTPENSAKLAERLKFATPNKAAFELLPADQQQNKNLYPPEAVVAKGEGVTNVAPEIAALYDRYWTQLTSS